jgi:hypothetical protein
MTRVGHRDRRRVLGDFISREEGGGLAVGHVRIESEIGC